MARRKMPFEQPDPEPAPATSSNGRMPTGGDVIERAEPLRLAEHYIDNRGRDDAGELTLRRHRGTFWRYERPQYVELEDEALDAELYTHLDGLRTIRRSENGETFIPIVPKTQLVREVRSAMPSRGLLLDDRRDPPFWLDDRAEPDPASLILFQNGALHIPSRSLYKPSPKLFSVHGLPFAYDPGAPEPAAWLAFLNTLWPDDPEAIATLQEWIGYSVSPWTSLQKILLLVGPKRSGKGTVGRVMTGLLGAHNVAGPTLGSLSTNFGLSALLHKPLAIISDARLSGRTDQAVVVERLLTISGEDPVTVDRKHRDPITVKLPTRIMIATNELPRLTDSSGALASRFIVLRLTRSFYGHEDHELTDRLLRELPGIVLWALDGWERLKERGRFVQPSSSEEAIAELEDLGSPIGAFIRERCIVDPAVNVAADRLFGAWQAWCELNGREKPGTVQVFGRDLRAALPSIKVTQPRTDEGGRARMYEGVTLHD